MPSRKIDFKHVRENADFIAVLQHYNLGADKDGTKESQFKAFCPFHDDHKPSLKVNTKKNIFNCFACETGGNILEFVTMLENGDPQNGEDLRAGAFELAEICGIDPFPKTGRVAESKEPRAGAKHKASHNKTEAGAKIFAPKNKPKKSPRSSPDNGSPDHNEDQVSENPPLSFELQCLETEHAFFSERNISTQTIERFGLGIAKRGMMRGRLVIPIRTNSGDLVAYCGRWPSSEVPEGEPKYKLPPKFRKELELYGIDQIPYHEEHNVQLIVVESYLSVWRLAEAGYDAVSPMGRSISDEQSKLIVDSHPTNVTVMCDGDEPGWSANETIAAKLANAGVFTRIVRLDEGVKPHHLEASDLRSLLG